MIDPEHLNDLAEMTVGQAARAAFLHAASAEGLTENSFHQLSLDLYSLLVLTVGQRCTSQDVSSAVCVAAERLVGERDPANVIRADFEPVGEVDDPPLRIVPVEKFVREAAAALDALNKYVIGERVHVGQDRATATPAVIVAAGDADWLWWVAAEPSGTPWQEDTGRIYRAPLTQPTPFSARHGTDTPGGAA